MPGKVKKIIAVLIVLTFISTSTNLNYISSYISSNKDTLRGMSAIEYAAPDVKQTLLAAPKGADALLPSSKTTASGRHIAVLRLKTGEKLKQMLKNSDLKPPARRLIRSLLVWLDEKSLQQKSFTDIDTSKERQAEIEALLKEIESEINTPGTGRLPELAVISDYHGEINLFLKYVADAISQNIGKKIELDHKIFPRKSLKEQLDAQGVDITKIDMEFLLLGDFLDRGAFGVKCFRLAEEMVDLGAARYVTGNHDLWAFLNVMGFHLPIYKDYNFYGHQQSKGLVEEHWNDPEIAENRIAWWTEKLAEYNAAQKELQENLMFNYKGEQSKVNDIRKELKATYLKLEDNFSEREKELWQDLVGYYFGTTDVYTGFRAAGMMSAQWWKEKADKIDEIIESGLKDSSAEALDAWSTLRSYAGQADIVVKSRLKNALSQGDWWWQVFNDINHQNYTSVEWWGKDWSSHSGWGTSVIDELNILDNTDAWNQANYAENQHLKDLALFYRKNFTLYQKDAYGNVYTHGWLPIIDTETGRISFTYKDVTYTDGDIWKGLDAIQNDVRDLSKPLSELHEALSTVNSWYADKTTKIKPEHIKTYIQDAGLEKIYKRLGIRCWFTCHNPLNKLAPKGINFKTRQGLFLHFSVDKGMSYKKFKDLGAYTSVNSEGIFLRGFSSSSFQRIIDNPPTLTLDKDEEFGLIARKKFPNNPLERESFLLIMREQLRAELSKLKGIAPEEALKEINEILNRFHKRFEGKEPPSGIQKTSAQLDLLKEAIAPLLQAEISKSSAAGVIVEADYVETAAGIPVPEFMPAFEDGYENDKLFNRINAASLFLNLTKSESDKYTKEHVIMPVFNAGLKQGRPRSALPFFGFSESERKPYMPKIMSIIEQSYEYGNLDDNMASASMILKLTNTEFKQHKESIMLTLDKCLGSAYVNNKVMLALVIPRLQEPERTTYTQKLIPILEASAYEKYPNSIIAALALYYLKKSEGMQYEELVPILERGLESQTIENNALSALAFFILPESLRLPHMEKIKRALSENHLGDISSQKEIMAVLAFLYLIKPKGEGMPYEEIIPMLQECFPNSLGHTIFSALLLYYLTEPSALSYKHDIMDIIIQQGLWTKAMGESILPVLIFSDIKTVNMLNMKIAYSIKDEPLTITAVTAKELKNKLNEDVFEGSSISAYDISDTEITVSDHFAGKEIGRADIFDKEKLENLLCKALIPLTLNATSEESDKASSSGQDKGPFIQDTVKELQQLMNTGDVNIPEYKDFIKRAIRVIEIEQQGTGKEKETLKTLDTARLWDGLTNEKAPDSIMAVYNNISLESIAVYTERRQGSEEKLRQLEMINYILLKYLHNKIGLADSSVKSSPAGNKNNIQAAIQLAPDKEPSDLMFAFRHSKEAPKVIINNQNMREFTGLTTERSNRQLKAFLETGFEAVVVLGELPVEHEGISSLLSGQRRFPDTISGMLTALSIIEKAQSDNPESFKPAYYFQLKALYEESADIMSATQEDFVNKYSYIPLIVDMSGKMGYGQKRKAGFWQSIDLWKALDLNIISLEQAKREVIKELSIEDEILYQIRAMLDGIDKSYISQMLFAYKPSGIKYGQPPISAEIAEYRRCYIETAIADNLNMGQDEVAIIYAGEGIGENIIDFINAGYNGIIIYDTMPSTSAGLEDMYKFLEININELDIIHALNEIDYIPWQKVHSGEDVSYLFIDRSKDAFNSTIYLAVTAGTGIGEYPTGAYCGNIPAEFLKKAGVRVVLLPSSLDRASKQRIISELERVSIDHADIPEDGYKGPVIVQSTAGMESFYTYNANVFNFAYGKDANSMMRDIMAQSKLRTTILNVPLNQLREVSQQLYPKSSSSGKAIEIINRRIDNSVNALIKDAESRPDKISIDRIKSVIKLFQGLKDELEKTRTGDVLAKEKTLERISEILSMLTLPFEIQESLVETADIKGIAADENRKRIGGIIIDDKVPDIGFEEQQVLLALYGKSSPIRQALVDKLNAEIMLYSQYTSKDYMPNMIAISKRRLEGVIIGLKRIEVVLNDYAGSFMPMGPNLVLAQQLLLYNIDKNNSEIRSNISSIYYMLSKRPMADDIIENFYSKGLFRLELPPAVALDRNYYRALERISAYVLKAA